MAAAFAGLEFLATAVLVLDGELRVVYANPAAEDLLGASARALQGQRVTALIDPAPALERMLEDVRATPWMYRAQDFVHCRAGGEPIALGCTAVPLDAPGAAVLIELRPTGERERLEREERLVEDQRRYWELFRNLAHEIKNPLGGLRGSAQLLERELGRPELKEYTRVIIQEADRLQSLIDRLLGPRREPVAAAANVHEILEYVRGLVAAEFGSRVCFVRDYDPSVPELTGDREQLIQALLNVVRNAAQAVSGVGGGTVTLRTRVVRQATLARRRRRLALELLVVDDGPGVPEAIRDRIFLPLVSGREGGTGLGLTLAQTHVQAHGGLIECESRPGRTVFRILLPLA